MPQNLSGKFRFVINKLVSKRDQLVNQPLIVSRAAWMGDNSGNITIYGGLSLPAGYVVVRDLDGNLSVAFNQRVPNVAGIPINVGFDPIQPTLFQVLSQRDAYVNQPFISIPPHHTTHEAFGTDQVWISGSQFLPALIMGNNGLTLTIFPSFYLKSDGTWGFLQYQTLDMTSYQPSSGAIALLVSVMDNGALSVTNGTTETTPELITVADFPAAPDATYHPLCAVRMFSGQTVITQNANYTDVFDLRFLSARGIITAGDGIAISGSTVSSDIDNGTALTSLVDADEIGLWGSVAAAFRKITWANFKASIKTYTDTLYAAITHALLSTTHSDTVASAPVLGGVIAANSTPAWQQIPGNTTAMEKFLAQTGNGSVSALPFWDVLPTQGILTYYFQNTASDISTYLKQLITPYTPKTTLSTSGLAAGNTVLKNFATDPGVPNLTYIPAGQFEFHIHAAQTGGTKNTTIWAEIWEVGATGVDIGKIGTSEVSAALTGSEVEYRLFFSTTNVYNMASSASRIVTRVTVTVSGGGSAPTVEIYYGGEADSHIALPSPTVDASNFVPYTGATQDINLGHKITNLTNGSGAQDAAAFGQIPTALPPNGSASGDLSGSYPSPAVATSHWNTQSVSGTATLVDGSAPIVLVDTSSSAFTLKLPAAPSAKSWFWIVDEPGKWASHNLTLDPNGKLINGLSGTILLNTAYSVVGLYYDGTYWFITHRWMSNTTPAAIGTAAVGTNHAAARADHVHATGAGTPSTQAFGDAASTGSGPAAAMTDHKHGMPNARTQLTGALTLYVRTVPSTVTISIASPAVVSWTGHGLSVNDPVVFSTTGALPTGITAGTIYYVISAGFGANSFEISTSVGGGAVNTSGSQSGTQSAQTGNDSNSGSAQTRAGAFLTIQYAVTAAAGLDNNGNNITIQLADGTYNEDPVYLYDGIGYGQVTIQGNAGTPANVVVKSFFKQSSATIYNITGMKFGGSSTGYSLSISNNAVVQISNLVFSSGYTSHIEVIGGTVNIYGSYSIIGGATNHFDARVGGTITMRYGTYTVTLTGTPAFTAFASCVDGAKIYFWPILSFSGAATGTRYTASMNGTIDTLGGGATYFPGNVAGTTASGGQYA